MSTLTDFTSYDEIRAVLGVSNEEIEDVTLALPMYHDQLNFRLDDIYGTLAATFLTIGEITAPSRTAEQARFYNITRLFCSYGVAADLIVALPMFSVQRVTDGKAEMERFDPMADMKAGVLSMLNPLLTRLQAALTVVDPTYSAPVAVTGISIVGVALARDPVTSTT